MPEVSARFLIESLVRPDGTAALTEVYDTANALGIPDQPVRLTIRRLVAAGAYVQEGRGRAGLLRRAGVVARTGRHDAEFLRFAYRRDAGLEPWDGRWHLVIFTVPESERATRDTIRRTLLRLGGAPLHPGMYVSPNDWTDVLAAELTVTADPSATGSSAPADSPAPGWGWTATTADLRHAGESRPAVLAARLWPLEEIAARYRRVALLAARPVPAEVSGHSRRVEVLRDALELAAAFDHAIAPDPLLPLELLPEGWPPVAARAAFRVTWLALQQVLAESGHHLFRGVIPLP
ncbi:PaaX family transcriptional regulator C-terminal domain-containing protein [Actinoplanes utahensis]|uniref:PaaX family transcriptional regulator C-terminal domain-containing protein n=1 Tax=Actinoplanes utahensis TaxID=1869 RepID=UPI00194EDD83|nr:PaaX family transcriptional regulator C-terminal domain-containing protein [Actinoplanes utahensis]GIF33655.1 putative repressor in the phenylacetic acid catabolism [Actinoplanes utahensis]